VKETPTGAAGADHNGVAGRVQSVLKDFPPLSRTLAAEPAERTQAEAARQMSLAAVWGLICHLTFAIAVLSMIVAMWFGMSRSFGAVPQPLAWIANIALIAQFPLVHSLLLTARGRRALARLAPQGTGGTLATTTYAIIASIQLTALFALWTPSGIVWWRADGLALAGLGALYASSWLFLIKASWDAGAEVQSGLLGWASLMRGVKPQYPPMPVAGTFRHIRQPIYLAFALTTWTVPVWTPDQLLLAVCLTAYCALGPLAKEKRFSKLFGKQWHAYRAQTPYWLPLKRGR